MILDLLTVSFTNTSPDKTIDGIKFSAEFYNSFNELDHGLSFDGEEDFILQDITIPPGESSGEHDFSIYALTAVKARVRLREVHFTDGSKLAVTEGNVKWVTKK